jgi:hypothetical protein
MLGRGAVAVGMILALAGVALAQTGEAYPPVVAPVPGKTAPRVPASGPVPVLTLAQKEELRKFCAQAANKTHIRCKGFAPNLPPVEVAE